MTNYSVNAGNKTVKLAKELYINLFVKYVDGNVKEKVDGQNLPKVVQPGYGEDWYRLIIQETGDKFKMINK